jgi:hypothetical protein
LELLTGRLVLSVFFEDRFSKFDPTRSDMMLQTNTLIQRIEELAALLDPAAFERREDSSLAKRRRAAWREAANRIGASRL